MPLAFDFAPHRLSGTVYGCLLNHRPTLDALGDAVQAAPYKGAPKAPVLYVQPRNTLQAAADGALLTVALPAEVEQMEVAAQLGLVIGRTACRLTLAEALDAVAGLVLVADLSVPHTSFYRPSLRQKVRDGSCLLGPVQPLRQPDGRRLDPDALDFSVRVDGVPVQQGRTDARLRGAAQLLVDVTEFMTLQPGDVLLLGAQAGAPLLQAGQQAEIELAPLGRLTLQLRRVPAALPQLQAPQALPTQRQARVVLAGSIHHAVPHEPDAQGQARLRLDDGRIVAETAVSWLPPFEVGTILALGLNYADHVKELAKELTVTAKDEPLVFLKGPGTLVGHQGRTRRPADAGFMHYECELAVVIGRTARQVRREDAMDFVAGYTVANDYAVRDYLENWYRPNLRVKNRDGATAIGPWFVPAAEVPEPHALGLRTLVNGELRQQGTTANMVNDIPALIEYLSSFMTLLPGDVILTGTPEGVSNIVVGDEVVTEIDSIGRLVNHIAGDAEYGR